MKSYSLFIFIRYFVMNFFAHIGETFCHTFRCDWIHKNFVDYTLALHYVRICRSLVYRGFSFFGDGRGF